MRWSRPRARSARWVLLPLPAGRVQGRAGGRRPPPTFGASARHSSSTTPAWAAARLIWGNTLQDWEWALGVNLMGVVHGVRSFVPMMLEAAKRDPG